MASPPSSRARLYVLTGAVAAITATGAWYGAGLKTRQEYRKGKNAVLEATTAERIEQMELAKARLIRQRTELQAKIYRLSTSDPGSRGRVSNGTG